MKAPQFMTLQFRLAEVVVQLAVAAAVAVDLAAADLVAVESDVDCSEVAHCYVLA